MKKLLPYNLITSIAPAGDVVWFGGWKMMPGEQDGLGLFEKRTGRWSLRLESEGIFAEEVNCLAVDGEKLWVGCDVWMSWNRGLYLYDPVNQSHTRFTKDEGLPHYRIKDICVDGDDVWAVTHVGAARYKKSTSEWSVMRNRQAKEEEPNTHKVLSTDFLICVRTDEENVWIGSFEGLERYHKPSGRWESLGPKNSIFKAHVSAICPDEHAVYFFCPPAIIIFDRKTGTFRELYDARQAGEHEVGCIRSQGDEVFFGTKTGGLYIRDKWKDKWTVFTEKDGLGDNLVYALGVDEDYVWCAGGMGKPLSRYNRRTRAWNRYRYREGIPCDHIYSLARSGDWLFVGTMANGFWKYDVRMDKWHNLNVLMLHKGADYRYRAEHTPIQFGDIYTLMVNEETVWMGTNHGLCRYPVRSDRPGFEIIPFETLGKRAMGIGALAFWAGKVFCGTKSKGLWAFDPANEQWEDFSDAQEEEKLLTVSALWADGDTLWVGTEQGLFALGKTDGRAKRLLAASDLPDPQVTALAKVGERLWIGTRNGLAGLDGGKVVRFDETSGLPQEEITALLPLKGDLWVGTRHGLVRYSPETGRTRLYDGQTSGLAGDVVGAITSDGQELWVSTLGGGMSRSPLQELDRLAEPK